MLIYVHLSRETLAAYGRTHVHSPIFCLDAGRTLCIVTLSPLTSLVRLVRYTRTAKSEISLLVSRWVRVRVSVLLAKRGGLARCVSDGNAAVGLRRTFMTTLCRGEAYQTQWLIIFHLFRARRVGRWAHV